MIDNTSLLANIVRIFRRGAERALCYHISTECPGQNWEDVWKHKLEYFCTTHWCTFTKCLGETILGVLTVTLPTLSKPPRLKTVFFFCFFFFVFFCFFVFVFFLHGLFQMYLQNKTKTCVIGHQSTNVQRSQRQSVITVFCCCFFKLPTYRLCFPGMLQ